MRFALPAISYVCEVAEDGALLAGIEMDLPGDDILLHAHTCYFPVCCVLMQASLP